MKPDENNRDETNVDQSNSSQQAAARVVRAQIDNIYGKDLNDEQLDSNPYDWTHAKHVNPQADKWKQYHSAWQEYYQKYYEGYYAHHYGKSQNGNNYFTNSEPVTEKPNDPATAITEEQAVADLRHKLLDQVTESAEKVKKSRHFRPLLAGLFVVIIFAFIQYNSLIISHIVGYISPGNIDIQNIVIDPNTTITVDPAPRIIIPKINVDAPVAYDIGNDYDSQMAAMADGLAHFAVPGANSHPGQIGNTVIAGHSSSDLFGSGEYKFIFVQLEKMAVGDSIYANYQSKRYTYIVTEKKVVAPDDVASLVYPVTKPILTLLTCVPIGTANSRLLVIAEQVSPDPSQSIAATTTTTNTSESIPGKQPTLFERIFGWRY